MQMLKYVLEVKGVTGEWVEIAIIQCPHWLFKTLLDHIGKERCLVEYRLKRYHGNLEPNFLFTGINVYVL